MESYSHLLEVFVKAIMITVEAIAPGINESPGGADGHTAESLKPRWLLSPDNSQWLKTADGDVGISQLWA